MPHSKFTLKRFEEQGTLSDPKGIPDPEFSLPATLNWMRALAILVEHEKVNVDSMKTLCKSITKAGISDQAINTAFEQLLMSLHHLASLKAMASLPRKIDTARSAIVTWYYGIYKRKGVKSPHGYMLHMPSCEDLIVIWKAPQQVILGALFVKKGNYFLPSWGRVDDLPYFRSERV